MSEFCPRNFASFVVSDSSETIQIVLYILFDHYLDYFKTVFFISSNDMKEKQAFIIFVNDSFNTSDRNEAISKLYMNKIAIEEENQMEILKVEQTQIEWIPLDQKFCLTEEGRRIINASLKTYKSKVIDFQIFYDESKRPRIYFTEYTSIRNSRSLLLFIQI